MAATRLNRDGPAWAGCLGGLGQFRTGGIEEFHALGDLRHGVVPMVFILDAEGAVEVLALELRHLGFDIAHAGEIGRASCRERV